MSYVWNWCIGLKCCLPNQTRADVVHNKLRNYFDVVLIMVNFLTNFFFFFIVYFINYLKKQINNKQNQVAKKSRISHSKLIKQIMLIYDFIGCLSFSLQYNQSKIFQQNSSLYCDFSDSFCFQLLFSSLLFSSLLFSSLLFSSLLFSSLLCFYVSFFFLSYQFRLPFLRIWNILQHVSATQELQLNFVACITQKTCLI